MMEKMNDCKFQQLSSDEMKLIDGGWGWRTESVSVSKFSDAWVTSVVSVKENIFGKEVDRKTDYKSDN